MKRITRHLTYANVMPTIAVFLALGGGLAWALGETACIPSRSLRTL